MSKITLDAETFKALASATRLTVLKALDERRKTLSELARDLDLNKATVHEHLGLLLAAGLVRKRDDEGRKWIYYELTWTGQSILRPEATTTFNVLLGLCALSAGGGMFMLGRALDWWLSGTGASTSPSSELQGGDGDATELRSNFADNATAGEPEPAAAGAPASGSGTASSTQTQTGAQSASGTQTGDPAAQSATGTETQSQQTAAGGAQAQDSIMYDYDESASAQKSSADHGGLAFFDDGGWIALALMAAFVVFMGLVFFLHWRMRPKPFDPEAAAQAEAEMPPQA